MPTCLLISRRRINGPPRRSAAVPDQPGQMDMCVSCRWSNLTKDMQTSKAAVKAVKSAEVSKTRQTRRSIASNGNQRAELVGGGRISLRQDQIQKFSHSVSCGIHPSHPLAPTSSTNNSTANLVAAAATMSHTALTYGHLDSRTCVGKQPRCQASAILVRSSTPWFWRPTPPVAPRP